MAGKLPKFTAAFSASSLEVNFIFVYFFKVQGVVEREGKKGKIGGCWVVVGHDWWDFSAVNPQLRIHVFLFFFNFFSAPPHRAIRRRQILFEFRVESKSLYGGSPVARLERLRGLRRVPTTLEPGTHTQAHTHAAAMTLSFDYHSSVDRVSTPGYFLLISFFLHFSAGE